MSYKDLYNEWKVVQEPSEEKVNTLLRYMAINKLACNDDKTHILVMKHGQVNTEELTFHIGDSEIKETTNEKLLAPVHIQQ